MPSKSLLRAFVLLWWCVGVGLLIGSVQTMIAALHGAHGRNQHLVLLAGVEGVSALLFLVPWTLRVGAAGLLLTIAVAFGVHISLHQFRWDLLVFAAAVIFVAVHGTLTNPQWAALLSRAAGSART